MSHLFNTFDIWLANTNPETVAFIVVVILLLAAAALRKREDDDT